MIERYIYLSEYIVQGGYMNENEQDDQSNYPTEDEAPTGGSEQISEENRQYQQPQQDQNQYQYDQQEYQQTPQQPQQPMMPQKDIFEKLTSNNTLVMMVMIGLIVIMVGSLIINAASYSETPSRINDITTTGRIIRDIGVLFISVPMLAGAYYRDDLNKWMRIGMIGFALVMIIVGYFSIGFEIGAGTANPVSDISF